MTSTHSKISPDSGLTVNSQYDFFKTPATETTELGGVDVSFQPNGVIENGNQIQVVASADDGKVTNMMKSFIKLRGKFVKKTDGTNLPAAAANEMKVVAEHNLAHTLYDRVTLSMNGEEMFHTSNYAQLAHMWTLLHESKDTKDTRLAVEGWLGDDLSPGNDFTEIGATALTKRKTMIAAGKEVVMMFRPHLLFDTSCRHLPPNTSLKLVMHKANPKTFALSSSGDCDVDFKITSFLAVTAAWNSQLVSGADYIIPVDRPRLRTFTINTGVREHRVQIQEQDVLPLQIAVAIVEQSAMVGDFTKSQFKYAPNNIISIELSVDGISVGNRVETNFENGDAAHAYVHTLASLDSFEKGVGPGITYDAFKSNRTVFGWSLAETHTEGEPIFHLKQRGSLQIVIKFSAPTTNTLSAIVFDTREDLIKQNLEGNTHSVETIV